MARFDFHYLCILLVCVLTFPGCGDGRRPTYPAGGTVTLTDGTPLAGGVVEFQLRDDELAPTARARIQTDGSFQLGTLEESDGALEGVHRALVQPPSPKRIRGWESEVQRGIVPRSPVPRIDPHYQRFESSGLTFNVKRDVSQNQFHIRLETRASQTEGN